MPWEPMISGVLQLVVDLATETVPGVTGASVSVVVSEGGLLQTATASSDWSGDLDEVQYTSGGPCADASRSGSERVLAVGQGKYPDFGEAAAQAGVTSVWSLPLLVEQKPAGALNLYSTQVDHEPDRNSTLAQTFARLPAGMLADAARDRAQATNTRMSAALASRMVIAQAQGILMARDHIDADRAFDRLRRSSQRTNTKLRDAAAEVVAHTSARPDPETDGHADQ